jgi:hypothetical protein
MNGFISFFLSSKQLNLLQYLERPRIIFKNVASHHDRNKQIENLIKCFNSYNELKMSKEENLINSKLIENMDHFVKETFEKMGQVC